jgi:hypothetical protein
MMPFLASKTTFTLRQLSIIDSTKKTLTKRITANGLQSFSEKDTVQISFPHLVPTTQI